jgi:hypothetical protein
VRAPRLPLAAVCSSTLGIGLAFGLSPPLIALVLSRAGSASFAVGGVAVLGEQFPAAELPTANAVFVMVYCLGGVIGPSAGGLLMDAWLDHGLQALLSGAACILLGGLAL